MQKNKFLASVFKKINKKRRKTKTIFQKNIENFTFVQRRFI